MPDTEHVSLHLARRSTRRVDWLLTNLDLLNLPFIHRTVQHFRFIMHPLDYARLAAAQQTISARMGDRFAEAYRAQLKRDAAAQATAIEVYWELENCIHRAECIKGGDSSRWWRKYIDFEKHGFSRRRHATPVRYEDLRDYLELCTLAVRDYAEDIPCQLFGDVGVQMQSKQHLSQDSPGLFNLLLSARTDTRDLVDMLRSVIVRRLIRLLRSCSSSWLLDRVVYHLYCVSDAYWFVAVKFHGAGSLQQQQYLHRMGDVQADLHRAFSDGVDPVYVVSEECMQLLPSPEKMFSSDGKFNKDDHTLHIVLKARPLPSAGRMFNSVVNPLMEKNPRIRRLLIRILMACLLGSYTCIPAHQSRGTFAFRCSLYMYWFDFLRSDGTLWDFFKYLDLSIPRLLLHATQLNLISRIAREPSLQYIAHKQMTYREFALIGHKACEYVRDRLSPCYPQATQEEVTGLAGVCEAIRNTLRHRVHKLQLRLSFVKSLHDFVIGIRQYINAVPADWEHPLKATNPDQYVKYLGVSREHFELMYALVTTECVAAYSYTETYLLCILTHFGSTTQARCDLAVLLMEHEIGKKFRPKLEAFKGRHPHTYALVQTFSWIWCQFIGYQCFIAPVHYVLAQRFMISGGDDLHRDLNVHVGKVVAPVCLVCSRVNCAVAEFVTNKKRHKAHTEKQLESKNKKKRASSSSDVAAAGSGGADDVANYSDCTGFVNVSNEINLSIKTPLLYCTNSQHVLGYQCESQPLAMMPLLGRVILYCKKVLMLCPKCGVCMVLDPRFAAMTPDGLYVCARCTSGLADKWIHDNAALLSAAAIEEDASIGAETRHKRVDSRIVVSQTTIKCDLCAAEVRSASRVNVGDLSVVLCHKHIVKERHLVDQVVRAQQTIKKVDSGCAVWNSESGGHCTCEDIQQTCTGTWTKESLIKFLAIITDPEQVRISKTIKFHQFNVSRAPNRRPKKPRNHNQRKP